MDDVLDDTNWLDVIASVLADAAGVHKSAVSITLTSASVLVIAEIRFADATLAWSAHDVLSTGILASAIALEVALSDGGLKGWDGVEVAPTVSVKEDGFGSSLIPLPSPTASPSPLPDTWSPSASPSPSPSLLP